MRRAARAVPGSVAAGLVAVVACWPVAIVTATEPGSQEVAAGADLAVTLAARVDPIVAGTVQIYDVEVTNLGPATATGIELQHELPRNALVLGAEPATAACRLLTEGLIGCDLGTLAPGAAVAVELGVLIDPRTDGPQAADVVVAGSEPDGDESNDEAVLETWVVAARQMIATTRRGAPALGLTLREGETTVSLAFVDPAAPDDRGHRTEAPGYRSAALAGVPDFGGADAPEVAALAAGFEGGTRVVLVDAESGELLAEHDLAGSWLGSGIVAVPSFAGTAAAELCLVLFDRSTGELRLDVVDASSGASLASHRVAVGAVPTGVTGLVGDDGSVRELAIMTRSRDDGETRIVVADPVRGPLRHLELGPGLFPLGIAAVAAPGPESGAVTGELAVLVRRAGEGDLLAMVFDASTAALVRSVDFDDALVPGPFAAVPASADGPLTRLALLARRGEALDLTIKEAAAGATVSSIRIDSPAGTPVPLGLAWYPGSTPGLAVLYERPEGPSRVVVFDPSSSEFRLGFTLP